jgi:GalNAc-alpha-(1->4)-GalNAc-alpha-(1->3)-diNAcBac-PP-undecaprenol alpha-1,4-N-acetyl-D-galactosaminyltransferase
MTDGTNDNDITLIIGDMGNGGTQRVFATLANYWVEHGRKICLITQARPESDFHQLDPRVQRLVFGELGNSNGVFGGLFNNIARIFSLRRVLRQADARVTVAAVPPTAVLAVLAGIGLPTRIVVAERNDPARQSYGRYWDFLRRHLYPRAALVTANSQGALESLRAFVPNERLHHLPNPLVLNHAIDDDAPRQPIILNVGRLQRAKGQDVLIEAFAMIAGEFPQWRLAIAGQGRLEEPLRALVDARGITGQVDWLGESAEIWRHYAAASIFALPSRHEGMPNALLEAMGAGLPAVVTQASPGPLELVEDGVNGLVVPVDDPAALATALRTLIDDSALRARQGAAARERIRDFSIDIVSERWEQVLGLMPVVPHPPSSTVHVLTQ